MVMFRLPTSIATILGERASQREVDFPLSGYADTCIIITDMSVQVIVEGIPVFTVSECDVIEVQDKRGLE